MQHEGTGGSDVLVYDFTALPKTTSGSGLLTIATTGKGTDGIDLDQPGEFFGLDFGGTDLGRYECDDANDGGTLIPAAGMTISPA